MQQAHTFHCLLFNMYCQLTKDAIISFIITTKSNFTIPPSTSPTTSFSEHPFPPPHLLSFDLAYASPHGNFAPSSTTTQTIRTLAHPSQLFHTNQTDLIIIITSQSLTPSPNIQIPISTHPLLPQPQHQNLTKQTPQMINKSWITWLRC